MDSHPSPATVDTWFAPAGRAAPERLAEETRVALQSPVFRAIIESLDGYLMILNPQRQILAVNERLLKDLGLEKPECMIGSRPGEALSCIHATEMTGGCGTSKACATCGAVNAILDSQRNGEAVTSECLATVRRGEVTESAEFRVRATPARVGPFEFTILVFQDISAQKRRDALERVFFHDILNTVGGLMGWSSLLERSIDENPRETAQRIVALSRRLTQEIRDQRALLEAESGSLEVMPQPVRPADLFDSLATVFEAHDAARGKNLVLEPPPAGEVIETDESLLMRVLINMTKNALEAIHPGETVTVRFERLPDGRPAFRVHNPGAIPEMIALRIFQRSFSTKGGRGRGIGTYSVKLFGEQYLKGRVGFTSTVEEGTTFFIELPK